MDYLRVTAPQWADAAHSAIRCRVQFAGFPVDVPFMAMPDDPHAHGRSIFDECVAGRYGRVREWDGSGATDGV
ncbi:hypothetical protein [Paraburkholderia caffeinilytica]|uniref:hypothetical protein n=1 Tax=Paraburkholderia caffeinilytica TaxID=1761016 RepID=UPI003DA03AE9